MRRLGWSYSTLARRVEAGHLTRRNELPDGKHPSYTYDADEVDALKAQEEKSNSLA